MINYVIMKSTAIQGLRQKNAVRNMSELYSGSNEKLSIAFGYMGSLGNMGKNQYEQG